MKLKRKDRKALKAIALAATVPASAFIIGTTAGTMAKMMPPVQHRPQPPTDR